MAGRRKGMGRGGGRPPGRGTTDARSGERCPHAPACVGCPWVGRPYGAQLAEKQERLRAALAQTTAFDPATLRDPSGSPRHFGYRNQAKLVFRSRRVPRGGHEILLGVYRPGTHSVVPADGCAVHDALLRPLLRDLPRVAAEFEVPIFDERRRAGELRYGLARSSQHTGRVHLTLVTAVERASWMKPFLERLRENHPRLQSAFVCVNPTPGNVLLTPSIRTLFGPSTLAEKFGDRILESRPDAFVQANPQVATNLYRTAARSVRRAGPRNILDLYCGVGAIGLSVARPGDRLLGIETSSGAIACARRNARRIGALDAHFVEAPADTAAAQVAASGWGAPNLVIVNPPRKGLGALVARQVAALGPERLLYVSCDPTTLARDLEIFFGRGYRLDHVRAFDMLPQTPHVESLAVLSRDGVTRPR